MNRQRCFHPNCHRLAEHTLSFRKIQHFFCTEHFRAYKKLPAWHYDKKEDAIMRYQWKLRKTY